MTENYDVASRLAQGRPAVETVQRYVGACHQLGYQHPDLTSNSSQIEDWYTTEEGMDLGVLQRGCLALDSAVRSSHDALAVQDRQLARMPDVWQGVGGRTARDFLRRHGEASAAVVAAVQTAADALAALREELWRAVGAKADAVVAIEGRVGGARAEWSAASATVTTGAGDRAAASELVDQAVKPFVENTIGTEWLAAMQSALSSVNAAYERAVDEINAEPPPAFDVPGDFGPAWTPARPECADPEPECATPLAVAPAAATAPASWSAPAPAVAAPAQTVPPAPAVAPPAPALASAPAVAEPATPAMPPLGAMGSGMPDLGGGLSGLGQQFADTLSGLLGGVGGEIPELETPEIEQPELEQPDLEEPEPEDPEDEEPEEREETEEEAPVEETVVAGEAEPVEEEICEPAPEAVAAPEPASAAPPAEPLPPAEPAAAGQTPCEIAADEVPQVGEPPE